MKMNEEKKNKKIKSWNRGNKKTIFKIKVKARVKISHNPLLVSWDI